jgi:undecaprenyl-diphosphatase
MLVYFALPTLRSQRMRVVSVGGAVVLVTLRGFSRVYQGAHYVSDVVGGFAAGGAWLSAVITAREAVRRRDMANQRGPVSSP